MRNLLVIGVFFAACTPKPFPEKFYFGASTAGFQVDPGCPSSNCTDTRSDWYQWVTSESELQDLKELITFEPLENSPGFWELYEQDFDRAKNELGLNSIRVSIEWSRIFPNATDGLEGEELTAAADAANIATYHAQFAAMKARGLTPLVTIHHYTLPVWIHDGVACHKDLSTCTNRGWLDRERIVREMAKYAGFVAKEFGGEVDLWATQNEPFAVVLPGYLLPTKDRVNPPGLSYRYAEAKAVMNNMIEAHARAYDAVKANDLVDVDKDGTAAFVGLVYSIAPVKPMNPENRLDVKAAENTFYLYNTAFLDAVTLGRLDADLNGKPDDAAPVPSLAGRMDYLGLNYYTRITVEGTETASLPQLSSISNFNPLTLVPWEDYSKGIYDIQMFVKDRYDIPMMITETGTDGAPDGVRIESWLVRHLEWTKRAIKDGADVRGFFYWSLTDNYEWNHGMAMKFGLYEIANDAAKTRTPRSAVATYKQIIKQGDISAELLKKFPPE